MPRQWCPGWRSRPPWLPGYHALCKIPGRILHLIYIGRYLLTAAHCKYQNREPHKETHIKGRHKGPHRPFNWATKAPVVRAGAATIITINSMDIMNMADPARVDKRLSTLIPLLDRYIANRKITRQISCITVVFMPLALLSWNKAQLAAITVELGFCEI